MLKILSPRGPRAFDLQALVRDFSSNAKASPATPRPKASATSATAAAAASSGGLEPLVVAFSLFFDVNAEKPPATNCRSKFVLSGLPSSFRASGSSTHEDDEENEEGKDQKKPKKLKKEKQDKEKKDKKEKKKRTEEDDDDTDGDAGTAAEGTPMKRPSRARGSQP